MFKPASIFVVKHLWLHIEETGKCRTEEVQATEEKAFEYWTAELNRFPFVNTKSTCEPRKNLNVKRARNHILKKISNLFFLKFFFNKSKETTIRDSLEMQISFRSATKNVLGLFTVAQHAKLNEFAFKNDTKGYLGAKFLFAKRENMLQSLCFLFARIFFCFFLSKNDSIVDCFTLQTMWLFFLTIQLLFIPFVCSFEAHSLQPPFGPSYWTLTGNATASDDILVNGVVFLSFFFSI